MRRRSFLLGMLCSLVFGICVTFISTGMHSRSNPSKTSMTLVPAQPVVVTLPENRPPAAAPTPLNWERRPFNGQSCS